jgi:hypothetical protein
MSNRVLDVRWGRVSVGPEEVQRRLRTAFNLLLEPRYQLQSRMPKRPDSDGSAVTSQQPTAG